MTSNEIMKDAETRMEKALEILRNELRGLRTGRASPAMLDSLRVEAYGSPTPLKQIAQVSAPVHSTPKHGGWHPDWPLQTHSGTRRHSSSDVPAGAQRTLSSASRTVLSAQPPWQLLTMQ